MCPHEIHILDPASHTDEDQRRAAQRAVCHYAEDAQDAENLLEMLGLHPVGDGEARCAECKRFMARRGTRRRTGADGLCGLCADKPRRAARRAAQGPQ